ncbi:hypothetical protein [Lentisalinibacter sediminis]|uniref:hypothetical protein n=1 Tax=Lentisalinibacter sediminis TaxID=2992237 RepID=UPI00386EDD69
MGGRKKPTTPDEKSPDDWFRASSLPDLLRHDTWTPHTALSLICDIDPIRSVLAPPNATLVDYGHIVVDNSGSGPPMYEWISLLSDDPANIFRPDNEGEDLEEAQNSRKHELEKLGRWDEDDYELFTLLDKLEARYRAQENLCRAWAIYLSKPEHSDLAPREPSYYIDWAHKKRYGIPWEAWAKKRGLLNLSPDSQDSNNPNAPVSPRAKATYERIIGGLLEMLTGEINGKPNSVFRNQEAIVSHLVDKYGGRDGISERNLDQKFADARKRLKHD